MPRISGRKVMKLFKQVAELAVQAEELSGAEPHSRAKSLVADAAQLLYKADDALSEADELLNGPRGEDFDILD